MAADGTGRRGRRAPLLPRSVRARTTAGAVVVVGVALVVAGVVLVEVLRDALVGEVRAAARVRAAEVVAALEAGADPALAVADDEDEVVQVLDAGGAVVRSSRNAGGLPPVASVRPGRTTVVDVRLVDGIDADDDADDPDDGEEDPDAFVVAAGAVEGPGAGRTVLVGRTTEGVDEAAGVVAGLLRAGIPVLLVLVGATTWVVVGRALRPVEAIRAEVDRISATALDRRVPEPGGRDEVGRLADTMNRMLDRLQAGHERQRRFVSDASHELRSPVASIRQHAEVALAHPSRTTVERLAGTVLAEDLRVERLVADLLLLARADEGALAVRRRPVDVDDLVLEAARHLRATTALQVDTAGVSAGRVLGDAAALGRVLRNLTDNAARHATARVGLSLGEDGGAVVLAVDDDGPGIPADDRDRVLDRFVRLDDARARGGGGSGLGLAIVAEVVAAHGGEVRVGERPGGGARVEVRLPAADGGA